MSSSITGINNLLNACKTYPESLTSEKKAIFYQSIANGIVQKIKSLRAEFDTTKTQLFLQKEHIREIKKNRDKIHQELMANENSLIKRDSNDIVVLESDGQEELERQLQEFKKSYDLQKLLKHNIKDQLTQTESQVNLLRECIQNGFKLFENIFADVNTDSSESDTETKYV